MNPSQSLVDQFKVLALNGFSFLEDKGFHRAPEFEETTPTGATIVYLGRNVGFVFSLDVRDQCVDGQVVRVREGRIETNWEGGYSANLFGHLVEHAGYRGKPTRLSGSAKSGDQAALQGMIDGWVELLRQAGEKLLSDTPDSLPR